MTRKIAHSFDPGRVLLHPVWIASAITLAFNDHLFKASALLPDLVTGKLSDFVGLLVAPALLATVLRLRSRRSFGLAHIAIGVVFAAIQLVPAAADNWSALMGLFGFPWLITMDATDLVALPMLLVSFFALGAVATRVPRDPRRASQWALAAAGMMLCMGTSPPPQDPDDITFQDIFGATYVHNATGDTVLVRVRELRLDAGVDCDAISELPAQRLPMSAFEETATWEVPADVNIPVAVETGAGCAAALLNVEDLPTQLVFWQDGQFIQDTIPGEGDRSDDPQQIRISRESDGRARVGTPAADELFMFPYGGSFTEQAPECAFPSQQDRLAWSSKPSGLHMLQDVNIGPDGCVGMLLQDPDVPQPDDDLEQWYVCLPTELWGFSEGDVIAFGHSQDSFSGVETLTMVRMFDDIDQLILTLQRGSWGTVSPENSDVIAVVPNEGSCAAQLDEECGAARLPGAYRFSDPFGETMNVPAGDSVHLTAPDGRLTDLHVLHSALRIVGTPICGDEQSLPGAEFEVAISTYYGEQ